MGSIQVQYLFCVREGSFAGWR